MPKKPIFTDGERALLKKWITFYMALDTGERAPTTTEQVHFVQACSGQVSAKTDHERAYLKLKNLVKRDLMEKERRRKAREALSSTAGTGTKSTKPRKPARPGTARAATPPSGSPNPLEQMLEQMTRAEQEAHKRKPKGSDGSGRAGGRHPKDVEERLRPGLTSDDVPDVEEGVPSEAWGPREDWMKMRRGYKHLGRGH